MRSSSSSSASPHSTPKRANNPSHPLPEGLNNPSTPRPGGRGLSSFVNYIFRPRGVTFSDIFFLLFFRHIFRLILNLYLWAHWALPTWIPIWFPRFPSHLGPRPQGPAQPWRLIGEIGQMRTTWTLMPKWQPWRYSGDRKSPCLTHLWAWTDCGPKPERELWRKRRFTETTSHWEIGWHTERERRGCGSCWSWSWRIVWGGVMMTCMWRRRWRGKEKRGYWRGWRRTFWTLWWRDWTSNRWRKTIWERSWVTWTVAPRWFKLMESSMCLFSPLDPTEPEVPWLPGRWKSLSRTLAQELWEELNGTNLDWYWSLDQSLGSPTLKRGRDRNLPSQRSESWRRLQRGPCRCWAEVRETESGRREGRIDWRGKSWWRMRRYWGRSHGERPLSCWDSWVMVWSRHCPRESREESDMLGRSQWRSRCGSCWPEGSTSMGREVSRMSERVEIKLRRRGRVTRSRKGRDWSGSRVWGQRGTK